MKKLFSGFVAICLLVSCSGKNENSQQITDTVQQEDTLTQVAPDLDSTRQAATDALKTDSHSSANQISKETSNDQSKDFAKYDKLVAQFVASVDNLEKAAKKGKWNSLTSLGKKNDSLRSQINKVKKNLSPEQLAKVKKAEKNTVDCSTELLLRSPYSAILN